MVESVLLYGSEIWGTEHIDRITTAQSRILKRMLLLPANTPNYSVRWESGQQTAEIKIIGRCLKWWTKLLQAPDTSYIKQCYNRLLQESDTNTNWVTKLRDKIFPQELILIWNSQQMRFNDESWNQIISYHTQKLQQLDHEQICNSTSLYWYKDIALDLQGYNSFLNYSLPSNVISTFCQIRLLNKYNEKIYTNGSSHSFKNNDICTICNTRENDTLIHLLTNCNITRELRRCYLETGSPAEFVELLRTQDSRKIQELVNFVKQSLRIRNFILNE
jgi:hypothetical protein